jgi:hypothetical protein
MIAIDWGVLFSEFLVQRTIAGSAFVQLQLVSY